MSEDVVLYQIDPKTLGEIHEVVHSLHEHIEWLMGRGDHEAVGKLLPTMKLLQLLVISVYCANSEEIDDALTPLVETAGQLSHKLKDASPEERAELEKLVDETLQAIEALPSLKRSKNDTTH